MNLANYSISGKRKVKTQFSLLFILFAGLVGSVPSTYAGVNKCIGIDGKLEYRESPCAEGAVQKSINISGPASAGNAGGGKWFTLSPQEEYISDFNLQSRGTKEVTIRSNTVKQVMFRVHVAREQLERYRGNYPIEMRQVGDSHSLASFYAGLNYSPVMGEIKLRFKNSAQENFDILVVAIKQ